MGFTSYKGRTVERGQHVKLYRNLHKAGVVYSVMDAETGLVLGHTDQARLTWGRFEVSAAGRERVRRTGKKTVHAFVNGYWSSDGYGAGWEERGRAVTYNPYKYTGFVYRDTEEPVEGLSHFALVGAGGVFCMD